MKAILVEDEKMIIGEYPRPIRSSHDILIEVKATAVNRADIMQRKGQYPPPAGATPVLGLEAAGIVAETGSKVSRWKVGDRVFGLLPGGGYAQYASMPEEMAMAIPDALSYAEAASIPEVFLTAWQSLVWLAKIKKGEKVLIHAGASGVGTAAIQLAREMEAEVFITASAPKHNICRELGAQHTIDYRQESFREKIMGLTNEAGVDIIIDFVAAPYFQDNLHCLSTDGRLIMLALLGGLKVPEANLLPVLRKRLSILGSTLRSRPIDYQAKLTEDLSEFLLPRLQEGKIKPVIDSVFSWEEVNRAHAHMEANKNKGKIVLEIS